MYAVRDAELTHVAWMYTVACQVSGYLCGLSCIPRVRVDRGCIGDSHPVKPRLSASYRTITRLPTITEYLLACEISFWYPPSSPSLSRSPIYLPVLCLPPLLLCLRIHPSFPNEWTNDSEGYPRKHRSIMCFQKLLIWTASYLYGQPFLIKKYLIIFFTLILVNFLYSKIIFL